jgi:pantoate--beta-alanine ligase
MRVISGIDEYNKIKVLSGLTPVGLIPTMGALHDGHISLVIKAMGKCPLAVVSIYVNPTQFNNKEDLRNYPRSIEKDLALLGKVMRTGDIVFTPGDKEIYPEEDKRIFDFGDLDKVMEGLHRPGHFNGVAQVVSRLFSMIDPDVAFFGQKDFQQLTILKELVRQTGKRPEIIGCEIRREKDGLAMSSRNQLLIPEIRKNASIIYDSIKKASLMVKVNEVDEIKKFVFRNINQVEGFRTEYFEIVDDKKLIPLTKRSQMRKNCKYFGCVAAYAGAIRLIDNIEISLY